MANQTLNQESEGVMSKQTVRVSVPVEITVFDTHYCEAKPSTTDECCDGLWELEGAVGCNFHPGEKLVKSNGRVIRCESCKKHKMK